jgi:hypothetical protein
MKVMDTGEVHKFHTQVIEKQDQVIGDQIEQLKQLKLEVFSVEQIKALQETSEGYLSKLTALNDDYRIVKADYEEGVGTIELLKKKMKAMQENEMNMKRTVEEVKNDKKRQKDEFVMLQAKALKMSNTLKKLASNIASYLEENSLLKKKLERMQERDQMGFMDMTPRPNYREIFNRRKYKHVKEHFGLRIMQQHYSTKEVVEELIDQIKSLETKANSAGKIPPSVNALRQDMQLNEASIMDMPSNSINLGNRFGTQKSNSNSRKGSNRDSPLMEPDKMRMSRETKSPFQRMQTKGGPGVSGKTIKLVDTKNRDRLAGKSSRKLVLSQTEASLRLPTQRARSR